MDKALLVGINRYPGCPLQGCVNDVYAIRALLVECFGFKPENVVLLMDADATTSHLLMQLGAWLVQGSQPGDRLVFHYSGHGAQVPTTDPSEPDGLSEVICPVDFDWSAPRMITDKQLVSIFRRLPHGVIFNWISDSCHSGDLDREMLPPPGGMMSKLWRFVSRAKAGPLMVPRLMPGSPFLARGRVRLASTRGMCDGRMEVGFVAGCKSNQTSADTQADGKPCGALTHFLVTNLRAMPKDTILSKVVAKTSADLAAAGYSQRPLADGTRTESPFLI